MSTIHLVNRTILITRPQPGSQETARMVSQYGGIPLQAPLFTILPPQDPQPFNDAIAHLNQFDGVILTSANSAKTFVTQFTATWPTGTTPPTLFAVGNKTAKILTDLNWPVTIPNHPEGGEALGKAIVATHPQKQRFLFPRAEEGREELVSVLKKEGKTVTVVTAYRTQPVTHLPKKILAQLEQVDAITFFSPRSVEIFLQALQNSATSLPKQPLIAALSPLTAQTLTHYNIDVQIIATQTESEGMLQALADYWHLHPTKG